MAFGGLQMLPDGFIAAVIPTNWSSLGQAFGLVVEHKSEIKKTSPSRPVSFGKVIEPIKAGEIVAWFFPVGLDVCRPKIIGIEVRFPTILTHWDGRRFKHSHAIYYEDVALPMGALKNLLIERSKGKRFPPDVGLEGYLRYERMKQKKEAAQSNTRPLDQAAKALPSNIKPFEIKKQPRTKTAPQYAGAILKHSGPLHENLYRQKVPVIIESLYTNKKCQEALPYVFLVGWSSSENNQKIVASFTKGISTFTGEMIIRTQITSNGNLPEPEVLKHIMASILSAGRKEAVKRRWRMQKRQTQITHTPPSMVSLEKH